MTAVTKDSIEKQVLLRAPHARVWQALTDAREFGTWFGVNSTARSCRARMSRESSSRPPLTPR